MHMHINIYAYIIIFNTIYLVHNSNCKFVLVYEIMMEKHLSKSLLKCLICVTGACDEDTLSAFETEEKFNPMFASAFCMARVKSSDVYFSDLGSEQEECVPVFVSAVCSLRPTDLYFSELGSATSLTDTGTELCLGKETELYTRVDRSLSKRHRHSRSEQSRYGTRRKQVNLGSCRKKSCNSEEKRDSKLLSLTSVINQNEKKRNALQGVNKNTSLSTEEKNYLSFHGRRRKLLHWSGDSFNVKQFCKQENESLKESTGIKNKLDGENNVIIKENVEEIKLKYLHSIDARKQSENHDKMVKHTGEIKEGFVVKTEPKSPENVTFSKRVPTCHEPGCFKCKNCGRQYKYNRGLKFHQKSCRTGV
ncbi:uncharacterized protein LOC124356110 [Homalodisca vitripennis]|uniref:uncharacterized protein LOC124356110 n=1 Tax=Homalodisca vitripennis TaxID=197043 RepID=UPI001EEAAE34|nr:uncharacterized protein LOC124356110 [Homalodisca vitripennis]